MNLAPSDELIMQILRDRPSSSARDVAIACQCPNARRVYKTLERLEADGLVQRWQKPNRPWQWEVTPG